MIILLTLILPALSILTTPSYAAPHNTPPPQTQDLTQRDNAYNLKCGNAPSVVAGTFLSPSLLPATALTTPEKTGSSEAWMDYLWCTPNTTTYTFFSIGIVTPAPPASQKYDVNGALSSATTTASTYLQSNIDGPIAGGNWTVSPPGTNIEIFVQNSKGKMTYGILNSAMSGLAEMASAFIHHQTTIVFQINDGKWGEVGIGYVGFDLIGIQDGCVYDVVAGRAFRCSDVRDGWVIE